MVLEKTLENSLDCKESKLVNSKGNNLNIHWKDYAEAPILWSPDGKSQLTRKDPDVGKDLRQERRGWQRIRRSDSITDSMDMN